jgi:HD-like signal output (HDOD) protein
MKRRILFVDDEPRILEGLEDMLMRYRREWDMSFATGGREALERMRDAPFDVIVTDMRMPEMDGAALLRAVMAEHPETVRIVLSGYSEMQAAMRAVPVAHQFLHKPCEPELLEGVINRACSLQSLLGDEALRALVGRLKQLPALPATYAALQQLLGDDQTNARDLAAVIEQDMGMSAKVLQLVNSAFFGIGRPIAAIEQAVGFLGMNTIQQLVLAAELFDRTDLPADSGLSLEALRDHALLTAGIGRRIVSGYRREVEDATTAGLLHDIGKVVLAVELPAQLAEARDVACTSRRPIHQVEQELFGITHAEIGAYLLGVWGLPYPIVEAVANHHAPERVPEPRLDTLAAVHVADVLAHECEPGHRNCPAPTLNQDYLAAAGLTGQIPHWREYTHDLLATTP